MTSLESRENRGLLRALPIYAKAEDDERKTKGNKIFKYLFGNSSVLGGTGRSNDINCPSSKPLRLEIISAGFFLNTFLIKPGKIKGFGAYGARATSAFISRELCLEMHLSDSCLDRDCLLLDCSLVSDCQCLKAVQPSLCYTKAPVTLHVFQENAGRRLLTFQHFFFVSF